MEACDCMARRTSWVGTRWGLGSLLGSGVKLSFEVRGWGLGRHGGAG